MSQFKILVADDNRVSRLALTTKLAQWGYSFDEANDGLEAWELYQANNYSLVISDWMMPRMDGPELVQRIRSRQTPNYTYVMLLTSKSQTEDLVLGMEAGADDFLTNPVPPEELRVRLRAGERLVELELKLAEKNRLLESQNRDLAQVNKRMRQDLEAAAEIQRSYLPKDFKVFHDFGFAWAYRPCDELAGDMFSISPIDENRVGVFILDVVGHGVPAALLAVSVTRHFTSLSNEQDERSESPARLVTWLNRVCCNSVDRFVTLIYGVLDARTNQFTYVNAGHPNLLRVAANRTPTLLPSDDIPIGVIETAEYHDQVVQLEAGDRLLLYSDGLVEATNEEQEMYGMERFYAAIETGRREPLQRTMDLVVASLDNHLHGKPVTDDVSVLGIELQR